MIASNHLKSLRRPRGIATTIKTWYNVVTALAAVKGTRDIDTIRDTSLYVPSSYLHDRHYSFFSLKFSVLNKSKGAAEATPLKCFYYDFLASL